MRYAFYFQYKTHARVFFCYIEIQMRCDFAYFDRLFFIQQHIQKIDIYMQNGFLNILF